MAELRWILLVAGVVVLAGVYFYSTYRAQRPKETDGTGVPRKEPVFDAVKEEADDAPVAPEPAVGAEDEQTPQQIITIRLLAKGKEGFPAEEMILEMRKAGLRHGQYGIFHRHSEQDDSKYLFSIASVSEPGSFDLSRMKLDSYPGVSLFLVLPNPGNGVDAFDNMVETAKTMAKNLNGELVDEQGISLSIQRERFLREEVIQFEHHH